MAVRTRNRYSGLSLTGGDSVVGEEGAAGPVNSWIGDIMNVWQSTCEGDGREGLSRRQKQRAASTGDGLPSDDFT